MQLVPTGICLGLEGSTYEDFYTLLELWLLTEPAWSPDPVCPGMRKLGVQDPKWNVTLWRWVTVSCDRFGCNICKSFQPNFVGENIEGNFTLVSQCSIRVRLQFECSVKEKLKGWPGLTHLVISAACHPLYCWNTYCMELSADRAAMIDKRIALSSGNVQHRRLFQMNYSFKASTNKKQVAFDSSGIVMSGMVLIILNRERCDDNKPERSVTTASPK